MLIDEVERRRMISIFITVRAAHIMGKALSREKYLPYWEHAESALFGLVNGPIMYAFLFETDIMDPGYYRWILNMGAITHEGLDITLRERRAEFFKTGVLLPFVTCQPHYHTGSCLGYCTFDWFLGLGRAAKIYSPVHILPLILFRFNELKKDPMKQVLETAKGILLSCMFLTTYVLFCFVCFLLLIDYFSYVFFVKYTNCTIRNLIKKDVTATGFLAGFLTGFACLFERSSR